MDFRCCKWVTPKSLPFDAAAHHCDWQIESLMRANVSPVSLLSLGLASSPSLSSLSLSRFSLSLCLASVSLFSLLAYKNLFFSFKRSVSLFRQVRIICFFQKTENIVARRVLGVFGAEESNLELRPLPRI